jgi:hypothetical protein
MTEERYTTKKLLVLRKLTRAIADLLRGQLKEYLATFQPLLRPKAVLGQYVASDPKETVPGAEKAFKELQGLYEGLAGSRPFNLPKELKPPLEIGTSVLEITPTEYPHLAKTEAESKTVTVVSPLRWVLSYSGYTPRRLRELLADRTRTGPELQEFVLHTLVLHLVLARQAGVVKVLEALHFPVSSGRRAEFGDLPIPSLAASVSTVRPPDDVLIESTEISGLDVFEEVVNLDDLVQMRDPLKDRLIELVQSHGDNLLPA